MKGRVNTDIKPLSLTLGHGQTSTSVVARTQVPTAHGKTLCSEQREMCELKPSVRWVSGHQHQYHQPAEPEHGHAQHTRQVTMHVLV